jgi:hypothetical protein
MFKAVTRIALAVFLIIALGPQAVGNIMIAQQAWHDSGLVFESDLFGVKF